MKTITLNENDVSRLIRDGNLCLNETQSLDIFDSTLVLNINGYTSELTSITLDFEERIIENKGAIDYIKDLICFQLNLEPCEVIFVSRTNDEFQFRIRTSSNILSKIIVYERRKVEWTNNNVYDPKTKTIGPYKQLSDSAYFFRWLNE